MFAPRASGEKMDSIGADFKSLRAWRPFARWTAIGLVLHLIWELIQLSLYTIWLDPNKAFIAFAVLHCTAGDMLIAAASYLAAAVAVRDSSWVMNKPWRGAAIAIPLGVLYTGWSEWYNVYRAGSWSYLPAMPLLFGIGLSPLLQWVLVPTASVLFLRRTKRSPT